MATIGRNTRARGQAALESAIAIPLFMVFAYLILQFGHLGIGVAVVNYAASSVARQAVAQNGFNQGQADMKFKNIVFAGLESPTILHTVDSEGEGTSNMSVTACAQLPAFPLVGQFLNKAIHTTAVAGPGGCPGAMKWLGPVGISGAPYHFILQGQATARMNYNSRS